MEEIVEKDEAGNETARYVWSAGNARIDVIVSGLRHMDLLMYVPSANDSHVNAIRGQQSQVLCGLGYSQSSCPQVIHIA